MYRIQANIAPGLRGVELLLAGDDGGPEGIFIKFAARTTESIRKAAIPWFDGSTIDLDALKIIVPDLAQFSWATGQRVVHPEETSNKELTFTITSLQG